MAYQPGFDGLLTEGATYADDHSTYVIERHRVDDAVLPTGRVVGCDPLACPETDAFVEQVPPGRYELHAWLAVLYPVDDPRTERDRRVAALQLVVKDEPVVAWEPALLPGQDVAELSGDGYFGYGVDAGVGTLSDRQTMRKLAEWDDDRVDEVLIPVDVVETTVPGLLAAEVDEATGETMVQVTSGWGDGMYGTWLGRAADGSLACFVTDFMVVPDKA